MTPRAYKVTGHAIPVKRSSNVTRGRFNGYAIGSHFFERQPLRAGLSPVPSSHGIL